MQQRNIKNLTDFDLQIENGLRRFIELHTEYNGKDSAQRYTSGQSGKIYTVEEELIPRGTTVMVGDFFFCLLMYLMLSFQVRRVPMPRGEKKTWQVEPKVERTKTRGGGGEVSSLVVTSTSEEGRLDQVSICHLLWMPAISIFNIGVGSKWS